MASTTLSAGLCATARERVYRGANQQVQPRRRPGTGAAARRGKRGGRDLFRRGGVELEGLARNGIRLQTDGLRIRADIRPSEDPLRPLRNVIVLEPLEQRRLDLRLVGDGGKGDLLSFALQPKPSAET